MQFKIYTVQTFFPCTCWTLVFRTFSADSTVFHSHYINKVLLGLNFTPPSPEDGHKSEQAIH
jgi:hypothetical protein